MPYKVFVMRKILYAVLFALAGFQVADAQPLSVIFETDYGNDADDALALDVICKYCDAGKFRLLGVSTHKEGKNICEAVDGSLNWYGYRKVPVARSPKPVSRPNDGNHYADSVVLKRNAKGRIAFRPTHKGRYEDAVEFYRRTLSAQPDSSVAVISVGFATNLALLLDSKPDKYSPLNGRELVAKKVKVLSAMMGCYRDNPFCEYNVNCDVASMRKLMAEWPGEIVQNPFEIGERVKYAVKTMRARLSWCDANPLLTATVGLNPDPDYRQCQFDVMSVIYLVHPEMFTLSQNGTISIDERGFSVFSPSANGRHRFLTATPAQENMLLCEIEEMTSAKPKRQGK